MLDSPRAPPDSNKRSENVGSSYLKVEDHEYF